MTERLINYNTYNVIDTMKLLLLALMMTLLLASQTSATCPALYTTDCNLINQINCPLYYSNTSSFNASCYWDVALCVEANSTCDVTPSSISSSSSSSSSMSSSLVTTSTTLVGHTCTYAEQQLNWNTIGVQPAYQEVCIYYYNGTLMGCYGTNETICMSKSMDYIMVIRPTAWNPIDNPVNATTDVITLVKPVGGIIIVIMAVAMLLLFMWKMFFKTTVGRSR